MTWEELESRADKFYLDEEKKIKIPYSHYDFDREVEPPHLMSTEINSDNFHADDRIYFEKSNARLELTTDIRNRKLEKRVENEILYGIIWKREVTYIASEKVWNISYFFEI
jgi:hypothetical protein